MKAVMNPDLRDKVKRTYYFVWYPLTMQGIDACDQEWLY